MFFEKLTEEQIREVMNVISDDGELTILKIRTYDQSFDDAVAFSNAEASRKCDFSFKAVLLNCILKKLHDVRRAFQVTGAAYADLYYHNFALTSFSKKSVTVSGVTEKNASSTVTHTPC